MSAAKQFALEPSGSPAPCGFPRCILESFHEGDHAFPKPEIARSQPVYTCSECGTRFVIYGELHPGERRICDKPECLLSLARREATEVPVSCSCPQREYPHELSIHAQLKSESYNPKLRLQWPWSLMLSRREEPSTERKAA